MTAGKSHEAGEPVGPAGQADSELIPAADDGDEATLTALLRRHEPGIRRQCRRALAREADAEDVTQEVLLKLYEAVAAGKPPQNVPAWLYKVAENEIRDFARMIGRAGIPTDFSAGEPVPARAPDTDPGCPEDEAVREADASPRRQAIDRALAGIEEKYRDAIIAVDLHEQEHGLDPGSGELGEALGCTPELAAVHKSRAHDYLKASFHGLDLLDYIEQTGCTTLPTELARHGWNPATKFSPAWRKRLIRHATGSPKAESCPVCKQWIQTTATRVPAVAGPLALLYHYITAGRLRLRLALRGAPAADRTASAPELPGTPDMPSQAVVADAAGTAADGPAVIAQPAAVHRPVRARQGLASLRGSARQRPFVSALSRSVGQHRLVMAVLSAGSDQGLAAAARPAAAAAASLALAVATVLAVTAHAHDRPRAGAALPSSRTSVPADPPGTATSRPAAITLPAALGSPSRPVSASAGVPPQHGQPPAAAASPPSHRQRTPTPSPSAALPATSPPAATPSASPSAAAQLTGQWELELTPTNFVMGQPGDIQHYTIYPHVLPSTSCTPEVPAPCYSGTWHHVENNHDEGSSVLMHISVTPAGWLFVATDIDSGRGVQHYSGTSPPGAAPHFTGDWQASNAAGLSTATFSFHPVN